MSILGGVTRPMQNQMNNMRSSQHKLNLTETTQSRLQLLRDHIVQLGIWLLVFIS